MLELLDGNRASEAREKGENGEEKRVKDYEKREFYSGGTEIITTEGEKKDEKRGSKILSLGTAPHIVD